MKTARYLLVMAIGLVANVAHALPSANGSISISQFGTITTAYTGLWSVSSLTTSVTVPTSFGSILVSSVSDPYLGSPNNLSTVNGGTVTSFPGCLPFLTGCTADLNPGGSTFTFPVLTGAISPFSVDVGSYTFLFDDETVIAAVNGSLSLQFAGYLFNDSTGTLAEGPSETATFSASFSQSAPSGAITGGYSLDIPPATSLPGGPAIPEPEMLGLLGIGLAGFGMIARRKVRSKLDKKLA